MLDKISKDKFKNFSNVYGNNLKLYIHEVPTCLQITILSCQKTLYRKCIFLFIITTLNLLLLFYNLIRTGIILLMLILILVFLYNICTTIIEENITIIKNLGIEISKRNIIRTQKSFLPWEQIQTIFINEVIFGKKVLFIMAMFIKVSEKDKLVPLFTDTLPSLSLLAIIFKPIKYHIFS